MLTGRLRIAIDIGGTFTDLQVLEEASGRTFSAKTPTTAQDPSLGFKQAILEIRRSLGFDLEQVGMLFHGTTIATNAVLEDKLPRGALITTEGFRDVIEIGRHTRRNLYALRAEPRRLLVPRRRRFEIRERVLAGGEIERPLDEESLHRCLDRIEASGAACVAVALLHAYANPEHELAVGEALEARFRGKVPFSLSHQVSPELREFERTSTTVLNALLMPVASAYIKALERRLGELGFAPHLYLVQSNGGVVSPEVAARLPARLLLSGPSGGAIAAERLAASLEEPNLIGVDLGGTSFDVCVLTNGRAQVVNQTSLDGCPVRLPMVEIRTIGAGGGSLARVAAGRLEVGPESAGASPGPACYRRGGTGATLTDANVVLGRLHPEFFLGGTMLLDEGAARHALETAVGQPLGLAAEPAAQGVVRVAVDRMASAIRLSLFEKGLDPKDFGLVSFGGAGGLHAAEVAALLDIPRVLYPAEAGTLSAWGMLYCDVAHAFARTRLTTADRNAASHLRPLAEALAAEGRQALATDGIAANRQRLALALDMRYAGQAFELTIPVGADTLDAAAIDECAGRFHQRHQAVFAHSDPVETPEIVTLRLEARGVLEVPREAPIEAGEPARSKGERGVWIGGGWQDVPVFERSTLGPSDLISGPAIVDGRHSTLYIPPEWWLESTPGGHLAAQRLTVNPMAEALGQRAITEDEP